MAKTTKCSCNNDSPTTKASVVLDFVKYASCDIKKDYCVDDKVLLYAEKNYQSNKTCDIWDIYCIETHKPIFHFNPTNISKSDKPHYITNEEWQNIDKRNELMG